MHVARYHIRDRIVSTTTWPRPDDARATVLCVHGFGVPGYRTYRRAAPYLRYCGYHIIAPDLPGFGSSGPASPYSLSSYAQDLGELVNQANSGPVVVVGHSMGAKIALAMAIDHHSLVNRLILVNPGGFSRIGRRLILLADHPFIAGLITHRWLAPLLRFTPLGPLVAETSFKNDIMRFAGSHRDLDLFATGYASRLSMIRCPVTLIWGERDPILPKSTPDRLLEFLPTAEIVKLPESGHAPMGDQPKEFAAVVDDFISRAFTESPEAGVAVE